MANNVAVLRSTLPDWSPSQLALIRNTVAKDTTPDEFNMFVHVCRTVQLDPFRKQIYCLVYSKDDTKKRRCVFVTGIDGFRAVAARNKDYRPDDREPEFTYDESLKGRTDNPLGIVKATVRCFKRDQDGQWYPVAGTAYWSEFAKIKRSEWIKTGKFYPAGHEKAGKPVYRKVTDEDTDVADPVPEGMWATMPYVLLAKCAEAQALRRGWPENLSGLYSPEEMDQADNNMRDITPSASVELHDQNQRLDRVKARDAISIIWKVGEVIEPVPVGKLFDRIAEYVRNSDMLAELKWWTATNTASLNAYWAVSKNDALAAKKIVEERLAVLEKAERDAPVEETIKAGDPDDVIVY